MSNMLREKIAREVRLYGKNRGLFAGITVEQIADRILDVLEAENALRFNIIREPSSRSASPPAG